MYIALDVECPDFGDLLGEVGRTGWKTTSSDELPPDIAVQAPHKVWHRLYAKKQMDTFAGRFGP